MKYSVISQEEISAKEWGKFVFEHPNGNIFQTPEMYEVYKHTKNYEPIFVGVTDNSGDIVGLILSVIQKEFSGPLGIFSSRCVTWGGPLIKEDLNKENKITILEVILKEQNKIAKKKALYMEFRNLWNTLEYKRYFEQEGYNYEDHLDVIIDLSRSVEKLWKELKNSKRRGIKKAIKSNLIFHNTCNVNDFYEVIRGTYSRIKLPLADISLFRSVSKFLQPKKEAYIFCISNTNEKILATRFELAYKNIVYDWYAGSTLEGNKLRANEYAVWNIILWAKGMGYKVFDFGGAGKPKENYGPGKFKMEFGGQVVNYGRYKIIFRKIAMKTAMIGLNIWRSLNR